MKTATHVHLRFTQADLCDPESAMPISRKKWMRYRNLMLTKEGFDIRRKMTHKGNSFEVVYSQKLREQVA